MTDIFQQPDMSGLSKEERAQVLLVMQKAKEFEAREEQSLMMQPLEGLLYKYTNVMKGWQYRWFVLDPISGLLHYYEKEEYKKTKPRGSVDLAAASVCPSDEDGLMFSINAANGDITKLRAQDARERQHWVTRLRATAEHHTAILPNVKMTPHRGESTHNGSADSAVAHHNNGVAPDATSTGSSTTDLSSSQISIRSRSTVVNHNKPTPGPLSIVTQHNTPAAPSQQVTIDPALQDAFKHVKDLLQTVNNSHHRIVSHIQKLPDRNKHISALDKDILVLKATSSATISCLEQCQSILQQQVKSASLIRDSRSKATGELFPANEMLDPMYQHSSSKLNEVTSPISPTDSFVSAAEANTDNEDGLNAADGKRNGTSNSSIIAGVNMATRDGIKSLLYSDEIEDRDDQHTDGDVDGLDEQKSVILHLLSQLKLGMDLTKVVLPTFILERRSLLEMFADFMAHPDLFLKIADCPDAESRMLAMVEWYLTSFHAGRNGDVAKKPYNPIIGETFHCSWHVPPEFNSEELVTPTNHVGDCDKSFPTTQEEKPTVQPTHDNEHKAMNNEQANVNTDTSNHKDAKSNAANSANADSAHTNTHSTNATHKNNNKKCSLHYCAEQVSHHPPVSAFYVECPEKQMYLNGSIWTKSKFMGMSIGVMMIGKISLHLLSLGEEYIFSLPSAYARSILSVPWVELGDKISIHCPQSGLSANVTFHTKPFYGGKLHRTTAEVKNLEGDTICKAAGEWNSTLEFTYTDGTSKIIDTSKLKIMRKSVRPLSMQGEFESRKLWQNVTRSLSRGDVHEATKHKHALEEAQRTGERHRKETNTLFPTKYFHKLEGDHVWMYKNPLNTSHQNNSVL